MPPRATIIDYGLGNLFSLRRALSHLGAQVSLATTPGELERAERLILPGVGAFGDGMRQLRERGLADPVRHAAAEGRPLLGICLGMQLFFTESEEFGRHEGLGIFAGRVGRLADTAVSGERVKVPHVGWNALAPAPGGLPWECSALRTLAPGDAVYFVHSYVPRPEDGAVTAAQMTHGGHRYCAMVQRGAVVGCQFHPEKSGAVGLRILRTFLDGEG